MKTISASETRGNIIATTPQKYHMPKDDVARVVSLAKGAGILVFTDDAHMASRAVFYDEPLSLELGDVDVTVWSLDKHVPGPRGAAVVAKKDLMEQITINEDLTDDGFTVDDTTAGDATVIVNVEKGGTLIFTWQAAITNGKGVAKFQWKDVGTGNFTVIIVDVTHALLNYEIAKNVESADNILIN